MSRERAAIPRGTGYQLPRRQSQYAERQRVRHAFEKQAAEPQKRSLAQRVLPGRRRKARAEAKQREHQRRQFEQMEKQATMVRTFRRAHRRTWKGILTVDERMRLSAIGRARRESPDARVYRHPQARKMARLARQAGLKISQ